MLTTMLVQVQVASFGYLWAISTSVCLQWGIQVGTRIWADFNLPIAYSDKDSYIIVGANYNIPGNQAGSDALSVNDKTRTASSFQACLVGGTTNWREPWHTMGY